MNGMLRSVRRVRSRLGRALRRDRYTAAFLHHLHSTRTTHVLDVGANEGQFATLLRSLGFDGRIVSFEPVAESFRILERHASGDSRWTVHNFALGDEEGEMPINILPRSDFNSFLQPNRFGLSN
jgi:hypothetical protein